MCLGSGQSEMSSVAGDTDTEGEGGGASGLDNILHTLRYIHTHHHHLCEV